MAMSPNKIQQYGDELYESLVSRVPVDPLTNREADITIEDAYQIQLRMIERRLQQRVLGGPQARRAADGPLVCRQQAADRPKLPQQLAGVLAAGMGMLVGSLGPQTIANRHGSHHRLAASR